MDTREVIEQPETDPVVSAAVIWEIETERAAGRLKAPSGVLEAQTPLEGLTLVTRDERLGAYDVPILPA